MTTTPQLQMPTLNGGNETPPATPPLNGTGTPPLRNTEGRDIVPEIHVPDGSVSKKRQLDNETLWTESRKKTKMEDVYNSAMWTDPRKHVDDRIRKVVREKIFSRTKFCKGEGVHIVKSREGRRMKEARKTEFNMSHERIDITKPGYANEVLKRCDVTENLFSLEERSLWWKVYCAPVKDEIMSLRGRKSFNCRHLVQDSKYRIV